MILELALTHDDMDNLDGVARQAFDCLAGLSPIATYVDAGRRYWELYATVRYSGDAEGRMLVSCDTQFAFAFTEYLMHVPRPSKVDDDVVDALGELANTIGGNFKGLLPPGTVLSTPHVATSDEAGTLDSGDGHRGCILYEFGAGCCRVAVYGA